MSIPGNINQLLIGAAASSGGSEGPIKSVRFNKADSAYLNKSFSTTGDQKTFTISLWIKKCLNTTSQYLFTTEFISGGYFEFTSSADQIQVYNSGSSSVNVKLERKLRDPFAWYLLVLAVDTTQATESDRLKIYINGEHQTDYVSGGSTFPAQNDTLEIPANKDRLVGVAEFSGSLQGYFDGYMADFYFIDGAAKDVTDFGAFDDNGVWQAAAYSGTFGTNGFHLFDFANESTLGHDSSGNENDWTANNFTTTQPIKYASRQTFAQNGTVPNGTSKPYWIDLLPTGVELNYTDNTDNMALVHDGSTTTSCYWVGNLSSEYGGNVTRARFDLRSFGTITSVRIYGGFPSGYVNYEYRMLDSSKSEISGTDGTFGAYGWHDMTITGDPEYFEISCEHTVSTSTRHRTYAVEVNGTILTNGNPGDMDILFDVPTNGDSTLDTGAGGEVSGNYATWNPLKDDRSGYTEAPVNGNLDGTPRGDFCGTLFLPSGKWYWEVQLTTAASTNQSYIGVLEAAAFGNVGSRGWTTAQNATMRGSGSFYGNGSTGSAVSYEEDDVLGFALDADSGKLYIHKNGTYVNSGDPAAGTGHAFSGLDFDGYVPIASDSTTGQLYTANFGQRPFGTPAPDGFKPCVTTFLPEATITNGAKQMDTVLYTGTEAVLNVTGYEFAPDFVWRKGRQAVGGSITESPNNLLFDIVRGAGKRLISNDTSQEDTGSTTLTSFNSDGFTLGNSTDGNDAPQTYAAWAWNAGTTTSSNTDGDITSSVRANQTAGFSIVSYTGTGNSGDTVGHGLNAAPEFILTKRRDASGYWPVYHEELTAGYALQLDANVAEFAGSQLYTSTAPTSSVFSVGNNAVINGNTATYISYCFTGVEGYSKFGSYTGIQNVNGPFVYTGFRPSWLFVKYRVSPGQWYIYDYKRSPENVAYQTLQASQTDAENTGATNFRVDILSNGFKLRQVNGPNNNGSYVFAAFAENPFRANGGLAR